MFLRIKRIDRAYQGAPEIIIDDNSRIVLMSDVHRGCGSWADDFAKNQIAYVAALKYYHKQGFSYIELGDGDELWKNKSFMEISSMHSDIFMLLAQFYKEKRLYMLYGNHDLEKKYKPGLLDMYYDLSRKKIMPLFPGAPVYEGIRLKHQPTGKELLLVHGHQADFFNDVLWRLARFLVQHIWEPLELIGFNNPTSAAKNNKVKDKIERNLRNWTEEKNIPLIAGHTHRPVFPEPQEGKYFNDGSCVHPWSITALELAQGAVSLIKWTQKTKDDGTVYVGSDIIGGPRKLTEYFA